jgi:hypothetical protein
MESVRAVLKDGRIPIVVLTYDENGTRSMTISSACPLLQYTAISHVWSDGMADPRQNGLLECQLTKLEADLRSIQDDNSEPPEGGKYTLHFWIDVFCVPCAGTSSMQESIKLKSKAIQLMAPTYGTASQVLIIDKRTEAVSSDVCAWLSFLPWITRCWTLQEASLARNFYVRCAGPPLRVWSRQLFLSKRKDPPLFVTSLDQLLNRDTSQREDIHMILANICGLSVSQISNLPATSRPKAFLRWHAPRFPFSLLLQKISAIADRPRDEWWIPSMTRKLCFEQEDIHPVPIRDHGPENFIARIGFLLFRIKKRTIKVWPISEYGLQLRICRFQEIESVTNIKESLSSRVARVWKVFLTLKRQKDFDFLRLASLRDAVLHEKGIIFDPSRMERRVMKLSASYSKNFTLQVSDQMMWFQLDLDPIFTKTPVLAQKSNIWLILPKNTECLSAERLLGRGLCIVQLGKAENVTVPVSLRRYASASHWTVTPSMFSSAFTCGVVTSLTQATTIKLPSARGEISKSPPFCLQVDVASWPAVRDVNEERASHPNAIYPMTFLAIVITGFTLFGLAFTRSFTNIFLIFIPLVILPIAFVYWLLCSILYIIARNYRIWVQSLREDGDVWRTGQGNVAWLRAFIREIWFFMICHG